MPGATTDTSTIPQDERPDAEVVRLAFAEIQHSGGQVEYYDASIKVMKNEPRAGRALPAPARCEGLTVAHPRGGRPLAGAGQS